jgi:hypothetical protein
VKRLLAALLVVVSLSGCAELLENQTARYNALAQLGESDARAIQTACEIAAGRSRTPDELVRVASLCHRTLADYERLLEDLIKLDQAIESKDEPEVIEALLIRAVADEARIVQDLEDISQEGSSDAGSSG